MGISEIRRDELFRRAGGKCECTNQKCDKHTGRCNAPLKAGWEAHHKDRSKGDGLSNLEAMCESCHINTPTYGQPK
jgi:hypothetical protein